MELDLDLAVPVGDGALEAGDAGAIDRIVLAHSIPLSTGGVPLIYLGDEVGQLNDYGYRDDPAHRDDSRWVNRPPYPEELYAQRHDETTAAGMLYSRLTQLLAVRRQTPEFTGGALIAFDALNRHVIGYQRPGGGTRILCLANFADDPQTVTALTLSGLAATASDLIAGGTIDLRRDLEIPAHGIVWMRVAE